MTIKILLDTDIGSDIDDSVALAYLLSNPECDLLGITTVTGEAVKRARMASALCTMAGRDIPIYPGAELPLLRPQKQPFVPQAAALDRWPHKDEFPLGEYLSFMRTTIRSHPGEVVLLTIGPLTNIALLFRLDPEIPKLLKSLVMMCGVFSNKLAGVGPLEWNALLDPHATAIVYKAKPPIHRSIGLDVTCQVTMPAAEVRKSFRTGLLQPVLDFAEIWFKERSVITFHDPLAAVNIFDDSICGFESGVVDVELTSERMAGLTAWTKVENGGHQVALTVNSSQFFKTFFNQFKA